MALRVFNVGETAVSSTSNRNTATTPVATTQSAFTETHLIAAVYPDDTTLESVYRINDYTSATAQTASDQIWLGEEFSNEDKTDGNSLKVYDASLDTGVHLPPSVVPVDNYGTPTGDYYFVMVHSDNHLKHHFARITEIVAADGEGDTIRFEPSLGNEIPKNTKFQLFKGPALTSDIVAIGLGIKTELQNNLNIGRPYFWFKDKKNELDNNTKYYLRVNEYQNQQNGIFKRIDLGLGTTFLVGSNYQNSIKDYSRFSLITTLTDNLKDMDINDNLSFTAQVNYQGSAANELVNITNLPPDISINELLNRGLGTNLFADGTYVTEILSANSVRVSNNAAGSAVNATIKLIHSNETHLLNPPWNPNTESIDLTDYEKAFFHARRDGDDLVLPVTNYTSRGPVRYLHYNYSNDKVNYTYNVMDMSLEESISGKTSFCEVSMVDMMKIYPSKLENNDLLRVRQRIDKSSLHSWKDTGLIVGPNGAQQVTLNNGDIGFIVDGPNEITNYFSVGEEINIENRLYIIEGFDGSGDIKLLQADPTLNSVNTLSRLESESTYTNIGVPVISIGNKIYRRAYSPFNKTLITSFDLINNRFDDIYLVTTSINSAYNYFKCIASGHDNNLLTFEVELDKYFEEGLHFNGDYYLYYEKMFGNIESLDYYRKDSQSIMRVQGRNIMSKVLSSIVNTDTLFSKDIVYSTESPLNDLVDTGVYVEASLGSTTITFKTNNNASTTFQFVEHEKFYVGLSSGFYTYIGEASANGNATTCTLLRYSLVECGGSSFSNGLGKLYVARKNGNNQIKNIAFNKALSNNILVNSVTSLAGTSNKGLYFTSGSSLNWNGSENAVLPNTSSNTHPKAIGYNISKVTGEIDGADYQCVLDDFNYKMPNTLIDYSILDITEKDDRKVIQIAPYVPITLGRMETNLANTYGSTPYYTGLTTLGSVNLVNYMYITGMDFDSPLLFNWATRGTSILLDGKFVGFVRDAYITPKYQYSATPLYTPPFMTVILDRQISHTSGQTVTYVNSIEATVNLSQQTKGRKDTKNTHELKLINASHLHGGKIITHIHNMGVGRLTNVDFITQYGDGSQLSSFERFGNPLYSIYSLEKGNEINYAATHKLDYRIETTTPSRLNYQTRHIPLESRGTIPPTYSNYDGQFIGLTNTHSNRTYTAPKEYDLIVSSSHKSQFNQFDTSKSQAFYHRQKSADRMFIFVNSDELPYHQDRQDSLANSALTRDITKYDIIGLLPTTNANSADEKDSDLSTVRHTNVDADYSNASIISSDKQINQLMNTGIMRLTELVVDWAFNPIDPEKPLISELESGENKITKELVPEDLATGTPIYLQAGSYNPTLFSTDYQRDWIVTYDAASGGNPIVLVGVAATGDVLVAHDATPQYHRVIGVIKTVHSGGTELMFPPHLAGADGGSYYYGEVKIIRAVDYQENYSLKGHGTNDTFIDLENNVNMHKTAYFNNPAHTSNQRLITITEESIKPYTGQSFWNTVPQTPVLVINPAVHWFALQFYNNDGNKVGFFFWFNIAVNSDGAGTMAHVDTIPAEYASSYTASTHADGIDYTSVEIQLVTTPNPTEIHEGIKNAFNTHLATDYVFKGQTGNHAEYGGTMVTHMRTKRMGIGSQYEAYSGTVVIPAIYIASSKINTEISADDTGYGKVGSAYETKNTNILGGIITNYIQTVQRKAGTYLPAILSADTTMNTCSSLITKILNAPKTESFATTTTDDKNERLYGTFIPVALSSFKIEDSKKDKKVITAGETFPPIETLFKQVNVNSNTSNTQTLFGLSSAQSNFYNKYKFYSKNGSATQFQLTPNPEEEGNGLNIGFMPRLDADTNLFSAATSIRGKGGEFTYSYTVDVSGKLNWLTNLDLTGCYISRAFPTVPDDRISTVVTGLIHILSHEIDHTTANRVVLVTDGPINISSSYRIFQPNHTTFYDFSPTDINIGYIDSRYTKIANKNECYESVKSMTQNDSRSDDTEVIGDMQGIGSIYVLVDLSGKVGANKEIINNTMQTSFVDSLPDSVCLSDGENTFITGLKTKGYNLAFDTLKELKGITSMSEIMSLEVSKNFNTNSKRCLIGNTVTIVQESEELVKSLLEKENLGLVIKNEPTYPVYVAPDFKGTDLLTASRFLLGKKDRDISVVDGKYVIDTEDANDKYADVLLSESGKYNIYEYEKEKTSFNVYNEIIVYGSTHKSVKKDIRSIKNIGRKTLEVFDSKLTTQESVDLEARINLRLHSDLNYSYKITVSSNGLEQIKSGDIIQLEIPRENIQRDEFMVLSISHKLSNLMELELGKYSKSLGDRLVEIIREGNATKSYIRQNNFSLQDGLEMIDTINIKDIRILVRKRVATGSAFTLGFAHSLNTSTLQLGFEGGQGISFENLWEDNL